MKAHLFIVIHKLLLPKVFLSARPIL